MMVIAGCVDASLTAVVMGDVGLGVEAKPKS
jgi:hypothetical protein